MNIVCVYTAFKIGHPLYCYVDNWSSPRINSAEIGLFEVHFPGFDNYRV